ncbi:hypothetical protein N0V82_006008 [Gnomoniopsis sp. IMI 355080]|nr:hypothetical protein N0V82_006008 [Gnomoniopsis sp. IMI 355080]
MQFTTAILAFAATAIAAPGLSGRDYQCQFGQYACSEDGLSIKQCDISGQWVEIGGCGANEICKYDDVNYLPYCFSTASKREEVHEEKRAGGYPVCYNPGTYSCTSDNAGINVCNAQDQLVLNGWCPKGTHCAPLASAGGIPFCVNN